MSLAADVRVALRGVNDPCSVASGVPIDLDAMGLIEHIAVDRDGDVRVDVRLTSPSCVMLGYFTDEIERLAGAVPGVRRVCVTFDAGLDWEPHMMREDVRRSRALRFAQRPGTQAARTRGRPARKAIAQ